MTNKDQEFMQMAIEASVENVKNGGGPFGAVIVRN
ncbi:MAG: nucleoside deaminase, partial [Prevotella sp.]|nr:nucleoside deaminase [Prevotella sp.]